MIKQNHKSSSSDSIEALRVEEGRLVAAVIVTYNRIDLLKECLAALKAQSFPIDRIIVVDNASSDNTQNYFVKSNDDPVIQYVRLNNNTGGAGGFHEGLKRAVVQGYEFCWIMDDDAVPTVDALQELMNWNQFLDGEYGFLCSKVIDTKGETMNTPSIDSRLGINSYPDWDVYLEKGVIRIIAATFVSVLVPSKRILELGLPIKEMFIWGDDREFTHRITDQHPSYMVGRSVVTHKRVSGEAPDLLNETDVERAQKFFYLIRNGLFLRKSYGGIQVYLCYLVRYVRIALKLLWRGKVQHFAIVMKGILAGMFYNPRKYITYIDQK